MIEQTNPAKRASNFLNEFNTQRANFGHSPNKYVRHVFAEMYGFNVTDTSSMMVVLSDAWKLPVQIRESISIANLELEPFEHVIKDLEKVLTSMALDTSAQGVSNGMPKGLVASLAMISSVLNKDVPEAVLTEEKIEELVKALNDLIRDVKKAGLDREFTDFILHKANSIIYALVHYETLGPNEVIDRVDLMFGGAFRRYGKLTESKEKKGLLNRLLQYGAAIVLALNIANGSFELSDNLTAFIESGKQVDGDELVIKSLQETNQPKMHKSEVEK